MTEKPRIEPLDDLDRRILAVMQQDNRLSFAELAERVASSAASCMRRVKRLREAGVIDGTGVGDAQVGPITTRLKDAYWAKHEDRDWSTPVAYP